jgi:3-hydroxyacyl-[acyl-carrier-protein] dehydratase
VRFILVDKIVDLEPGKSAHGYRWLRPGAEYYADHLPTFPVEPGVLVLESMAQLGGRLVQRSVQHASGRHVLPILATVRSAEFKRPARPGARLDLSAEVLSIRTTGARVSTTAEVGGVLVASATVTYVLVALDHDVMGIGTQNIPTIREWGDRTWRELTDGTGAGTSDA